MKQGIEIKVKTGDIIFFKTRLKWYSPLSWLSVLIRFFAKIEYNHVGVIVSNWEKPFVNEAVGRGIISTPLNIRIKSCDFIIKRPGRNVHEQTYAIRANNLLGHTSYDVIGLLWHQLIWNVFRIWIGPKDINEAKEKMYCYEYAAYMNSVDYKDWWKVNPKKFYDLYTTIVYKQ